MRKIFCDKCGTEIEPQAKPNTVTLESPVQSGTVDLCHTCIGEAVEFLGMRKEPLQEILKIYGI